MPDSRSARLRSHCYETEDDVLKAVLEPANNIEFVRVI